MNSRFIALLFFTIVGSTVLQAGDYVYMASKAKLFYVQGNEIYAANGKLLLYFQKGNIFFSGASDEKQNIFLLTSSMNVASDKTEAIYEKDEREPAYTFQKYKFYSAITTSESEPVELLHIEIASKWLAFYSTYNDSLIAYFAADSMPSSTAILVAYTLIKQYELDKKTVSLNAVSAANATTTQKSYVTLKPMWGNITANEWLWDGKILRPKWNIDSRLQWTFDGQIIKPFWNNNPAEQYEWDGDIFKPVWRTNRNQEWSWDGNRLQPTYSTDWANQYIIEKGIIKPWSNAHPEREWQVDGDMPLPLIILVISGIASPN